MRSKPLAGVGHTVGTDHEWTGRRGIVSFRKRRNVGCLDRTIGDYVAGNRGIGRLRYGMVHQRLLHGPVLVCSTGLAGQR